MDEVEGWKKWGGRDTAGDIKTKRKSEKLWVHGQRFRGPDFDIRDGDMLFHNWWPNHLGEMNACTHI